MNPSLLHSCRHPGLRPFALFVLGSVSLLSTGLAQSPVFTPDVTIDQAQLLAGKYSLRKVLESGGQFFTTPFTPTDGMGEGAQGPRAGQRAAMYPANPSFPFLRVNGLDSQSCYECHNSIGSYREPGTVSQALIRKPGTVSGSGGFNSDAFINPAFPTPLTQLVRNPPHVFGTGYTQQLAQEMTWELLLLKEACDTAARAQPGVKQTQKLTAKGMDFGTYASTYQTGSDAPVPDTTRVTGVSRDLIVRPFQWKGIASSVRHFVRDALDFHFSMQAVEKVGANDCDRDGIINEVTTGNVSAIVSFVAMTRPPVQQIPAGQEAIVKRGETIFRGQDATRSPAAAKMCATCHTPSLTLDRAVLEVINPTLPTGTDCPPETSKPTLINPLPSQEHLQAIKLFRHYRTQARPTAATPKGGAPTTPAVVHAPLKAAFTLAAAQPAPVELAYRIDLTKPGTGLPSYLYPRLTAAPNGSVSVPLFSDLRTHDMGEGLKDPVSQGVDVPDISVPPRLFLTRPLWGVADTGPWLHDGRARTLLEAIQLHRSEGSEANPVLDAFNGLPPADQQAVVSFLLTLRLPLQQGLTVTN